MSFENSFACLVCGYKIPTIKKELRSHSSYGSGISERTFYDTSADAYFINVFVQTPFLRPYIEAVSAKLVDEEAILKAEYRVDIMNIRKPIMEKKCKDDIERFSDFASEFARPFENCIYQPKFAVHASEPACIDKISELGELKMKKRTVEDEKPDKMLVGEIGLCVDTVLAAKIFPKLSAYFEPLESYMEPAKANMLLKFMHFSEIKK